MSVSVSKTEDNKFGKVNTGKFKAMVSNNPILEDQIKAEFGVTSTKEFKPEDAEKIFARVRELKGAA